MMYTRLISPNTIQFMLTLLSFHFVWGGPALRLPRPTLPQPHSLSLHRKRLLHSTVGRKIISGRLIARREQSGRFGDGTKQEFPLMKSDSTAAAADAAAAAKCIFVCGLLLPVAPVRITSIGRGTVRARHATKHTHTYVRVRYVPHITVL